MKSGPTLKGCTTRPRRRAAAISASATVVLPLPLAGAAISTAHGGVARSACRSALAGRCASRRSRASPLSSERGTDPREEIDRWRAEAERLVVVLVEQVLDLREDRELGGVRKQVLERVRRREVDLGVRRVLVEREAVRRVHVLPIADDVDGEVHVVARPRPAEVAP